MQKVETGESVGGGTMLTDPPAKPRLRTVIRVFVRSTFTDLKHERDALQWDVFPKFEHSAPNGTTPPRNR